MNLLTRIELHREDIAAQVRMTEQSLGNPSGDPGSPVVSSPVPRMHLDWSAWDSWDAWSARNKSR